LEYSKKVKKTLHKIHSGELGGTEHQFAFVD